MTNPGFQDALDTPGKLIKKGIPLGMYNYQGSTTLAFQASSNPQYCEIWSAKDWITSFDDSYRKTIKGKDMPGVPYVRCVGFELDFECSTVFPTAWANEIWQKYLMQLGQ